jgi:hypothetical protein
MTETKLNHAMDVARWTCLAAVAKEGLSTKRMLRKDGTLRYGLELDIRRTLTACAAHNVQFLNKSLPTLSDDPSIGEVIFVGEAIGNQFAEKWVAGFDELMEAEAAKRTLHAV